jgi:hypothetical protein
VRRAAAIAALALAAPAGCDVGGGGGERTAGERAAARERAATAHERAIRGWSRALNAGDYARATRFFALGVIVEQVDETQLITREQILAFNRSLPCRADVTHVVEERQATLAAFRLKRGPGGDCHGTVRVRFTIHGGKFTQWRQLPQRPAPPQNPA